MMKKTGVSVLLSWFLVACGTTATPQAQDPIFKSRQEEAAKHVGKTYWVQTFLLLCDRPGLLYEHQGNCQGVNKGKLTVDDFIQDRAGGHYRLTMQDGRSGYVHDFEINLAVTDKDPVVIAAECKRRGDPRIGMTAEQVVATCWGKPETVNRTETGRHIHDQYVYSGNRYLYLEDGVLTSMQTSGVIKP
jgi:hypothetical protein